MKLSEYEQESMMWGKVSRLRMKTFLLFTRTRIRSQKRWRMSQSILKNIINSLLFWVVLSHNQFSWVRRELAGVAKFSIVIPILRRKPKSLGFHHKGKVLEVADLVSRDLEIKTNSGLGRKVIYKGSILMSIKQSFVMEELVYVFLVLESRSLSLN